MKFSFLAALLVFSTDAALAAGAKCVGGLRAKLAANEVQTEVVRIGRGQNLSVQILKPAKAGAPVYLLTPGVNRGLRAEDPFFKLAKEAGFGLVAPNFSVQPLSIDTLPKNEEPRFLEKDLSLKDLAAEMDLIAEKMKKDWGLKEIIPVTLSYSGAVSPFLKNHSLVIDVAPMTSLAAQEPQLESYRQSLKAAELWNPIFGPGITRAALDTAYRQTWGSQVDSAISSFKLGEARRDQMVEGYSVLSRAVEGFDWSEVQISEKTRRVFMLAGKESDSLLKDQIKKFLAIQKHQPEILMILVEGSEHAIPLEAPEAYLRALQIAQEKTSGLVLIDAKTMKEIVFSGAEAAEKIQELAHMNVGRVPPP